MSEKLITIKDNDLNKILGSNNSKFNKIKRLFPHIKLISRGDKIKVVGSKEEIIHFESKFSRIFKTFGIPRDMFSCNSITSFYSVKVVKIINML